MSSDISTNSSSSSFLTTFGGREAAGLYGPGALRSDVAADAEGVLPCVAAASSCRPEDAADPRLNVGVSLRGSGPEVASVPVE